MLLKEVEGKVAEQLKAKCPVGVFDIEDIGNGEIILFSFIWLHCYNGLCSGYDVKYLCQEKPHKIQVFSHCQILDACKLLPSTEVTFLWLVFVD